MDRKIENPKPKQDQSRFIWKVVELKLFIPKEVVQKSTKNYSITV